MEENCPVTNRFVGEELWTYEKIYPLAKRKVIGKSSLGQPIWGLQLGKAEEMTLMVGGVHGLESITSLLLLRFAHQLVLRSARGCWVDHNCPYALPQMLERKGVFFVPLANPDGVMLANGSFTPKGRLKQRLTEMNFSKDTWQANARGVDINHNFDADWVACRQAEIAQKILSPGPTKFGGRKPHSEKESKALVGLCQKMKFEKVMAFHSQGEEIYSGHAGKETKADENFGEELAALSGYLHCRPATGAGDGGFKDWFCDKTGRLGCTIEIGKGKNPLPLSDLEEIYPKLEKMLFCSLVL